MFDILSLCVIIGNRKNVSYQKNMYHHIICWRYIMDFEAIRKAAEGYKPAMVKFCGT